MVMHIGDCHFAYMEYQKFVHGIGVHVCMCVSVCVHVFKHNSQS